MPILLAAALLVSGCGAEAPRATVSPEYIAPATPEPEPTPSPEPERPEVRETPEGFLWSLDEPEEMTHIERPWVYDEGRSRAENIFLFLTEEAGLNRAAASGILANMDFETGGTFDPGASNSHSYGLCQWLGRRLENLKSWCGDAGEDWRTIQGQLKFLIWELQEDDPYGTWDELTAVENSAAGAQRAGWYFGYWFERPYDLANQARWRGFMAVEYFEEMEDAAA